MFWKSAVIGLVSYIGMMVQGVFAATLLVGASTADITAPRPVALDGQMYLRIAQKADTPITANVIVLESREGDPSLDAAVMVSCDFVAMPDHLVNMVRQAVQKRLPNLDGKKILLNATHTHTAPVTRSGKYEIPKNVMQVEEYLAFAVDRIAEAIERAWNSREPGSFTYGLGHAAVAENRRAVYADGHAEMYGGTNRPDFRGLEGYEDHDIGAMFFWNEKGNLLAMTINMACPSQEVEGLTNQNADFWHPVRERIHRRYGAGVCVLGWVGAAGDMSPHLMYRKEAEERMRQMRKLSRLDEIARRVVAAVNDIYETVKNDRRADVPLLHKTESVRLPMRKVTDAEYAALKTLIEENKPTQREMAWHTEVLNRYEKQKLDPQPACTVEIHAVRIGDAVVCTNPFELFSDYGVQMKARSRAIQTFVVQLTCGGKYYLPSQRAMNGGGYSAIVQSNLVGPEGGQLLVDRTVEFINSLWAKPAEAAKH